MLILTILVTECILQDNYLDTLKSKIDSLFQILEIFVWENLNEEPEEEQQGVEGTM